MISFLYCIFISILDNGGPQNQGAPKHLVCKLLKELLKLLQAATGDVMVQYVTGVNILKLVYFTWNSDQSFISQVDSSGYSVGIFAAF